MNDFNNFFDDNGSQQPERTPIYHTPDPPRHASKNNVALVISIVIAVIMTLIVIVNVILLATLKDTIAKEYADSISQNTREQYSNAIQDVLDNSDIVKDVTDNAAQNALDALKSSVGEVAYEKSKSVARIYMYASENDSANKSISMATAFLITNSDENNPYRYLVTNAHCAIYAKKVSSGGIFGSTYSTWEKYGKILAVFDNDETIYTLDIIAYGSYKEDGLSAENNQPDLALLRVSDASKQPSNEAHPALSIASSDYAKPGTPIALIGNPEGIGKKNSISTGCISQMGIEISNWGEGKFILTDAALNSGNSGGPMINKLGVVVGVAESKLIEESIDNMGFALAASTLCDFLNWASMKENNSLNAALNLNCSFA